MSGSGGGLSTRKSARLKRGRVAWSLKSRLGDCRAMGRSQSRNIPGNGRRLAATFSCSVQCFMSLRYLVRAVGGGRAVSAMCAEPVLYSSEGHAGAESFGNHCLYLCRIVLHEFYFFSLIGCSFASIDSCDTYYTVGTPRLLRGRLLSAVWRVCAAGALFAWLLRPDIVGTWWFVRV